MVGKITSSVALIVLFACALSDARSATRQAGNGGNGGSATAHGATGSGTGGNGGSGGSMSTTSTETSASTQGMEEPHHGNIFQDFVDTAEDTLFGKMTRQAGSGGDGGMGYGLGASATSEGGNGGKGGDSTTSSSTTTSSSRPGIFSQFFDAAGSGFGMESKPSNVFDDALTTAEDFLGANRNMRQAGNGGTGGDGTGIGAEATAHGGEGGVGGDYDMEETTQENKNPGFLIGFGN